MNHNSHTFAYEFPAKILPPLFTPDPTFVLESFPSVLQAAVQKGDERIQGFSEDRELT